MLDVLEGFSALDAMGWEPLRPTWRRGEGSSLPPLLRSGGGQSGVGHALAPVPQPRGLCPHCAARTHWRRENGRGSMGKNPPSCAPPSAPWWLRHQ